MSASQGWFLSLILQLALGSEPAPNIIDDVWESVQRDSAHIGFVHTTVESLKGGKLLRGTAETKLTFRRQGNTLSVRQEEGTDETSDGMVVHVWMRQFQGSRTQVDLRGSLEDGRMRVVIQKGSDQKGSDRIDRRLRWSEDVAGLSRRMHWFEEHKPRPGDKQTLQVYEPTYNTVVTLQAVAGAMELVAVAGKRQKLLRVDMKPEAIQTQKGPVRLPASVVWLDEHYVPVRRQMELEGLGTVVLTRCSRDQAMAGGGAAPDINKLAMIPLNQSIPQVHGTRSAVYRVTVKGDAEPGKVLVEDAHQDMDNFKGNKFDLHVHPVQPARREKGTADPEYLEANTWINSDDERVVTLAKQAAGMETDPWKKAQNIERWVKRKMKVDNVAPFVSAREVAKSLAGDCRHYALLTAALCRAQAVPSRTALGLIYVLDRQTQRPSFGFHMWTEVWIDGRWLGLDATLGLGHVGAGHIKITDHSWHDTQSLTPFLPVTRVLGKLAVEVLEIDGKPIR